MRSCPVRSGLIIVKQSRDDLVTRQYLALAFCQGQWYGELAFLNAFVGAGVVGVVAFYGSLVDKRVCPRAVVGGVDAGRKYFTEHGAEQFMASVGRVGV